MMMSYIEEKLYVRNLYSSEWLKDKFWTVFSQGHEPVFMHCDIANCGDHVVRPYVRPDGKPASELVLVDWEHAGWYTSYWEYCSNAEGPSGNDDWIE